MGRDRAAVRAEPAGHDRVGRWRPGGRPAVPGGAGLRLASERAIVAHAEAAQAAGAEIRARDRVLGWEAHGGGEGVVVRTGRERYEAARLVVTAGPWMADLVPLLRDVAILERQVLAWLQPRRPELFEPGRFPVFNLQVSEGRYYGFPVDEVPGFEFGCYHHRGEATEAEAMRREVDAEDERLLRQFGERYFPNGSGPTMALRACMFTNTPDEHFIIDRHPDHPQVVLASPCPGHGYKFCSVVGEILAELSSGDGTTRRDIGFLRLDAGRFTGPA